MLEPVPEPSYVPERRRVLPLERVGALVEILICSGFPTQILLILIMRAVGMPMRAGDGRLSPTFVFTLSLLDALLVIGLVLTFLRAHHESARDVLLGKVRLIREALLGLATLPAVFMLVTLVLVIVIRFAPQLHNVATNPFEDMLRTRTDAIIFTVVVMVAGGVREEVQRGFIAHRFDHYLGWGALGHRGVQRLLRRRARRSRLRRDHRHRAARVHVGTAVHLAPQHRRTARQPRHLQPRTAPEIPGVCGEVAQACSRDANSSSCSRCLPYRCRPSPHACIRPTRSNISRTSARCGSITTCHSRTSISTSSNITSRSRRDFHQTFLELETDTGRRINYGTVGCAILWSPFYAVADVVTRTMRAMGRPVEANGYSQPYISAVAYGSAFYGFAAIVLAIAVTRQVIGTQEFSSGMAVWFGTPLLF